MTEHGEFAAEVVVDANDLFLQISGSVGTADELRIAVAVDAVVRGKNTCGEQRLSVPTQHASGDFVSRERRTLHNSCRSNTPWAVGEQDPRGNFRGCRNIDNSRDRTEIAAI